MADCAACSRPAPDATICPGCADQAAVHLRLVPWLVEQLTITLTRQSRMGERNGPRGAETAVPFDHRASVDLETLAAGLARWAGAIAAHRGITVDVPVRQVTLCDGAAASVAIPPTAVDLSRWLLRWNGAAAQHPDAGEYVDDLTAMVRAAERTVDRAPDLRYVGPCDDCGQDLYVGAYAPTVTCGTPGCDAVYPTEERRAWLREQAEDQLRTAAQLSRELPWIAGVTINRKLINLWSSRGRITAYLPHPDNPTAPRFRVGEVIDRAQANVTERLAGAS